MRPAGLRYDRPSPPPQPIGCLLAGARVECATTVIVMGELVRMWREVPPGMVYLDTWCRAPDGPHVVADTSRLPLRTGTVRGAILDHFLPLQASPDSAVKEVVRSVEAGGWIVFRERNWAWELAGHERTVRTSFRRYGGELYFGEIERTLRPPREVERIWLLDKRRPAVARLLALPREDLARLRRADAPDVATWFLREERFTLTQFLPDNLARLATHGGLHGFEWLESDEAYVTLLGRTPLRGQLP